MKLVEPSATRASRLVPSCVVAVQSGLCATNLTALSGHRSVHFPQLQPAVVDGIDLDGSLAAGIPEPNGLLRADQIGLNRVDNAPSDDVEALHRRARDGVKRERERALVASAALVL